MMIIENTTNELTISLSITTVPTRNNLMEEFDFEKNCQDIISNVVKIIEEFGYVVLEKDRSPYSNSLYFIFCFKNEYDDTEVKLIVELRLSDHELPTWDKDKNKQDARNRQLQFVRNYANDNRELNKNLSDTDEIDVDQLYIKYENEFYTTEEDVYKKVRNDLRKFTNKHK